MRLLRSIAAAVAALGLSFSSAQAQTQDGALRAAYESAARATVGNAGALLDSDITWVADGRTGVIRFSNPHGACFDFFVRQQTPATAVPYTGEICDRTRVNKLQPAASAGPRSEPPPPPPAPEVAAPPPPPAPPPAAEPPRTRGLGARTGATRGIAVKPVVVQITRQQDRTPVNGGQAVVLLSKATPATTRNRALCDSLVKHFDDASVAEVRVGVQRQADGSVKALRPIYWPIDERVAQPNGDRCAKRLAAYDFTRAQTVLQKMRLNGSGPYLLVSRADEQRAATIDLSGMTPTQIEAMVVYFRDAFSQTDSVWDADRFDRGKRDQELRIAFKGDFPSQILAAFGFVSSPAIRAGCALGDLRDRSCGS